MDPSSALSAAVAPSAETCGRQLGLPWREVESQSMLLLWVLTVVPQVM